MTFILSRRSLSRLERVHADLVKVVKGAIEVTSVDFGVIEGLRTIERQKELVRAGASMTLNSRHLTGHAVDLIAYIDGDARWDWPLYHRIAEVMSMIAQEEGISLTWGGNWIQFKDGPHFELSWVAYPAKMPSPIQQALKETT